MSIFGDEETAPRCLSKHFANNAKVGRGCCFVLGAMYIEIEEPIVSTTRGGVVPTSLTSSISVFSMAILGYFQENTFIESFSPQVRQGCPT